MKILVLGGTLFLGRVVTQRALEAGHEVTLFNRGKTNTSLFAEIENLRGDRNDDLSALLGRTFDAVIDTSGYLPRHVAAVADVLDGSIGHYAFVSSLSVYADHSVGGVDESAGVAVADDPDDEDASENYGPFKALCEQTLREAFPGKVHNVRAGLIVGPYDNSGRFSYWVERMLNGGDVLAPEPKDQPVQFIDVRDLAEWILLAAEEGIVGTFNACNSPGTYTMQSMLVAMCADAASAANLCWVGEKFLADRGVAPWTDLPLWLPPTSRPTHVGFMSRDNSAAVSHGLTTRPLAETVSATRAWLNGRDGPAEHRDFGNPVTPAGLTTDREQVLLAAWRAQQR